LALEPEEKLLVAGSTHADEEEIILDVYKNLLKEFPYLRLLIAPRHPERAKDIEKIVIKYGFNPLKVSQLAGSPVSQFNRQTGKQANRQTVFLLDTIGQLVYFYNLADIVFVGGSLIKKGGHNILEPASLGKPIIFGPHMSNFRDIADLFLKDKAAVLARNKEELGINMRDLLNNPERIAELGQRARAVLLQNQGATRKNMEYISNYLSTERGCGI
jgi:3-deoxy-D-manno-octulosonic-acid transferase